MPTEICRVLVVYVGRAILYVRALTPLHVGVGRGYSAQVDLPVQRDEFGFPVIWSSSLKGALKAWVEGSVRKCFGPEPEELETAEFKQSRV
ncbi:MAG: RAMP superfamily CRISPR-associated protein, partial [Sulfolobales archaeon]|nr:RAMP superfamily CRISPR-associated protein [Sulfolobales archaeon]